jgi:hypothetical protein
MVAVSAVITWALRASVRGARADAPVGRGAPSERAHAGRHHADPGRLHTAYTLRDAPRAGAGHVWAIIAALAVTVGLHLWRRNALLSIVGDTLVNVLVVSLVLSGRRRCPEMNYGLTRFPLSAHRS